MLGLGLKNKFFNWTTIVERLTLELKKKKKNTKRERLSLGFLSFHLKTLKLLPQNHKLNLVRQHSFFTILIWQFLLSYVPKIFFLSYSSYVIA